MTVDSIRADFFLYENASVSICSRVVFAFPSPTTWGHYSCTNTVACCTWQELCSHHGRVTRKISCHVMSVRNVTGMSFSLMYVASLSFKTCLWVRGAPEAPCFMREAAGDCKSDLKLIRSLKDFQRRMHCETIRCIFGVDGAYFFYELLFLPFTSQVLNCSVSCRDLLPIKTSKL